MQQDDSGPTMEELIDKVKHGNNLLECVYCLCFGVCYVVMLILSLVLVVVISNVIIIFLG